MFTTECKDVFARIKIDIHDLSIKDDYKKESKHARANLGMHITFESAYENMQKEMYINSIITRLHNMNDLSFEQAISIQNILDGEFTHE